MRRTHTANKTFNGNLAQSTLINKEELPSRIQNKMKRGRKAVGSSLDIRMGNPSFYHPLFQTTNMLLPRDRRERNEWCRHFYRTEPIVGCSIDLHSEFPISGLNHICSDTYIKKFFDYLAFDKLNVHELLLDIGLEYWKIGDVFPMGQFNESEGMWENFTLLNPDYINLTSSIFAGEQQIELIPDEQIINIVAGGPSGQFGDLYRQFPEDIIMQVKQGKNITLDNRLVSHIAHKASPYEAWGTPLMMRCFKTLIYKDKLRQAQDAIANRHIFPIRVAKIGSPGEPMPTQDDLDGFRDILMEGEDDPNFFLVYHYGLSFEYVGSTGHLLPLNTEFEFANNELMMGLCINQALLNGDGTMYTSNPQAGLDILAKRYMAYRARLQHWLLEKVYKPVAEVQGFYKPMNGVIATKHMSPREQKRTAVNKEMQLIVPKILWENPDLSSNQTIMSFIQSLADKNLVSMSTVYSLLSLDIETEKRNLERERGTVLDPNSPKSGPLPNEGRQLITDYDTGSTVREYTREKSTENNDETAGDNQGDNGEIMADRPLPPNNEHNDNVRPTVNNNPEDFGMPARYKQTSVNDVGTIKIRKKIGNNK